jgi:hypothetical protein
MPRDLDEWPSRIKAIEREYSAVRLATERLLAQVRADSTIIGKIGLRFRDADHAYGNLEGTYLIRLFAEFETGVRKYWNTVSVSHPRTEDLVNGVAARRRIDHELINRVHAVREYRNSLVHEREEAVDAVSVSDARGTLCKFLGRLPPEWE